MMIAMNIPKTLCEWALTVLVLTSLTACSLPQSSTPAPPSDSGPAADADIDAESAEPASITAWRMMRIVSTGIAVDSDTDPGLDIDAIAVFNSAGDFLFAGCASAALWDTAEVPQQDLEQDIGLASLSSRDGLAGVGGYIALGDRILECAFPIAAETGARVEIWELDSPDQEGWTIQLSTGVSEAYQEVGISSIGSDHFALP